MLLQDDGFMEKIGPPDTVAHADPLRKTLLVRETERYIASAKAQWQTDAFLVTITSGQKGIFISVMLFLF